MSPTHNNLHSLHSMKWNIKHSSWPPTLHGTQCWGRLGGPVIKQASFFFAPNIISRVRSCKYMLNVERYLINYPHLCDYGQTIFCLSFQSRDRATAPGRYEQFYFTKHVPYQQNIYIFRGRNQIRLDPVQLFCNSFCVQHKMVGNDYPFILQCLVYRKKGTVYHWGILTHP
jgi:hypothetical protein